MLKRNLLVACLTATATFAGLGLSAFAIDDPKLTATMSANAEAQNAALADKVETLLRTDIGLAGSQIRVSAKSSVVTVSGSVPDEHAQHRALELASSVRGIREVRNAMEIAFPK
jgi:osmotically-inducible protein OsmY